MMQQLLPMGVQIVGEAVREALHLYVAKQFAAPNPPQRASPQSTPSVQGCPFCAISKHLAVAHRYLRRCDASPAIYPVLAAREIRAAEEISSGLIDRGDPTVLRLHRGILALEMALAHPNPSVAQLSGPVAATCWDVSDLSLTLAERENAEPEDRFDTRLRRMAERLGGTGPVIDGEARVLSDTPAEAAP